MGLRERWHIDAWSVRDGMAFASFRPPGQVLKAQRTVFIGAPSLEVVPLGSVSPALWATRANFQAGLWSLTKNGAEGESVEIGFDTLEQVRELVRRGYLAGGMGPGAPEGEPQPRVEGPDGPTDAGQRLEATYERLLASGYNRTVSWANPSSRDELFKWLASPVVRPKVREAIQALSAAVMTLWARQLAMTNFPLRGQEDFACMTWAITSLGLWPDRMTAFSALVDLSPGLLSYPNFFEMFHSWRYVRDWGTVTSHDLVFRAPYPRLSSGARGATRLSDKLLQFVLITDTPSPTLRLTDLVPAILAALLITATSPLSSWIGRDEDFAERLGIALNWLSAQMPQLSLPRQAEEAIDRLVDQQLRPE